MIMNCAQQNAIRIARKERGRYMNSQHTTSLWLDCVWNVMAHAQKPDFVLQRNGRIHLNRQGRQFSRLLAAEMCASAVVMLDTPCSEAVWRVLATNYIRQFPLHFPSHASLFSITFQLETTPIVVLCVMYAPRPKKSWESTLKLRPVVWGSHARLPRLSRFILALWGTCWGSKTLEQRGCNKTFKQLGTEHKP
jgi:hypothetical protein